nr:hypothetical protein HK105_008022 [Polyrhizophydium stewartii]
MVAALALTWICFATEFAGLFSGRTMFSTPSNALLIAAHTAGTVVLCMFITEGWHYLAYWYIFLFCRLTMPVAKIAPSMLSSDFAFLATEAQRMVKLGADYLHMDVMVRLLCWCSWSDCHLMVSNPGQWVDDFAKAGASLFTFHIEATDDAPGLIDRIHAAGMKAGISVKPKTSIEAILHVADKVDMVLVMTVEPGFGGQKMMPDCLDKVRELRAKYPDLDIEVDGGIDVSNIEQAAQAGANVIVAGTGIFGHPAPGEAIEILRGAVTKAQIAAA